MFARHVDSRSWDSLFSPDGMAGTNEKPDNEGWSRLVGRPASTTSVWEALVRSLQSGRSSTRLSRADPATERATSRGSPFHLSLPGRVPRAREWETRLYADTYSLAPYSSTFSRPPFPFRLLFFRIFTPGGSRNSARYVLCREKKRTFLSPRTNTDACRRWDSSSFAWYPPAFIPRESIYAYSATSTLKPLSALSLFSALARRNLEIGG